MIRFGTPKKKNKTYFRRPGVYALINVNNKILLTIQDDENQLPGGGIDKNESPLRALHREVMEETGWKIYIQRRITTYQKFIFMPEYNLWAHKICLIYQAKGIYSVSKPTEEEHFPILIRPKNAIEVLHSPADRALVLKYCDC